MNKEILRLAIPNILSNISVPLLSSFDTALMGRLSADHLGAVGLGSMIFNFVYWNFGFLRMGSTGMTAQAYGRENRAEMGTVLGQAALVAVSLALLLLIVQSPLLHASQSLLKVSVDQQPLVGTYFSIRIWAAPAALGMYALMGWYFGMQNAIYPLILTIVINVVNMLISYLLVWHYEWGIAGVAWGTVIAQYVGVLVGIALLLKRYSWIKDSIQSKVLLQWDALIRFLRINGDIFLRTLCLTLAFAFFYRQSAGLGDLILATNVILLQYVNWMSYGVDGFAFAAESLVGKYHGARQPEQRKRAIWLSFVWGMALAALYALLYGLAGTGLLRIFTDQQEIITAALPYLPWMIIFPLLGTPCYIWDGVYVGITASRAMRNTMVIAFAAYLALYYGYGAQMANHGLWLSLTLFMVFRGLVQWWWYWRGKVID
ncbi:MAG: MATE family efflux transporter [Bacteroidota bacterium]